MIEVESGRSEDRVREEGVRVELELGRGKYRGKFGNDGG